MMTFHPFVLALLVFMAFPVLAQTSKSLEQLRQEEVLRRAIDTIDEADAKLNMFIKKRESDCQRAVGYPPFCGCITKSLPIAWNFSDYVSITTQSKEENGYSKLQSDMRLAYDKVAPIRDACVRTINAKH